MSKGVAKIRRTDKKKERRNTKKEEDKGKER